MNLNVEFYSWRMASKFMNLLNNDIVYSCIDDPKDKAEVIHKIANEMIKFASDLILKKNKEWKN